MALFRCSNGNALKSIQADKVSPTLGTLTSAGGQYTATEDCIMIANLQTTGSAAALYINNNGDSSSRIAISDTGTVGNIASCWVGYGNYGMFIPKGSTIYSASSGTYNVSFYKVKY